MTFTEDARAALTGFGSIRVIAGSVETRGFLDDEEEAVDTGSGTTLLRSARVLRIIAADLPDLTVEQTIQLGTLDDDADLTSVRVLDIRREADGIVNRVWVSE